MLNWLLADGTLFSRRQNDTRETSIYFICQCILLEEIIALGVAIGGFQNENRIMKAATILVTGATAGLGKATAITLAHRGHRVLIHGRNEEKARSACESVRGALESASRDINTSTSDRVVPVWGDLSSLVEVWRLAKLIAEETDKLDILVNNAGKTFMEREESHEGVEMTVAVNCLAPFLLISLLEPLLAPKGRVVTLAGMYHKRAQLDLNDLDFSQRGYSAMAVANQSQLIKVLFSFALARRFDETGKRQVSVCIHPGAVLTNAQKTLPWYLRLFIHTLARPGFVQTSKGAQPIVRLTAEDPPPPNGTYFERYKPVRTREDAYDPTLQESCWQKLCDLSGAVWS